MALSPTPLKFALGTSLTIAALLPTAGHAGAWTRPQGDWMFMLPLAYVTADEAFDDSGDRVDIAKYQMFELSPLIEYGLTDDLTGGLQPKYRQVTIDTPTGDISNKGLAEADIYLRYRLWQEGDAAFSVQGTVKTPIQPDEQDAAALGRDQVDTEISLLYGDRIPVSNGVVFYNAELGYRKRFQEPNDEIAANAYVGWSPSGPWSFVLRSGNTIGLNNEEAGNIVLTEGPSYRRHEAQLITSYRFSKQVSGVIGVSTPYAGENVGVGNNLFLSMLYNF